MIVEGRGRSGRRERLLLIDLVVIHVFRSELRRVGNGSVDWVEVEVVVVGEVIVIGGVVIPVESGSQDS